MENKGYHFLVTHNSFPFSSVGRVGGVGHGWGGVGVVGGSEEAGGEGCCQESLVCSETQRSITGSLSFTPAPPTPPLLPQMERRCDLTTEVSNLASAGIFCMVRMLKITQSDLPDYPLQLTLRLS